MFIFIQKIQPFFQVFIKVNKKIIDVTHIDSLETLNNGLLETSLHGANIPYFQKTISMNDIQGIYIKTDDEIFCLIDFSYISSDILDLFPNDSIKNKEHFIEKYLEFLLKHVYHLSLTVYKKNVLGFEDNERFVTLNVPNILNTISVEHNHIIFKNYSLKDTIVPLIVIPIASISMIRYLNLAEGLIFDNPFFSKDKDRSTAMLFHTKGLK